MLGWLGFVFLIGGGSRHDIQSLALLRSAGLIAIAASLWFVGREHIREIRAPLILLVPLALLIAFQLVPLPPSMWSGLWNRDLIVQLGEVAGMADAWRPLSLSPMKTANALAAMIVPFATLALYALCPAEKRHLIWWTFLAAAMLSAVIGLAQITLGVRGLYFYRITNVGDAVGLFSNRNHNAVFMALAVCIAARLAVPAVEAHRWPVAGALAASALVLTVMTLVNGSRAGLAILFVAWLVSFAWLALGLRDTVRNTTYGKYIKIGAVGLGLVLVAIAALLVLSGTSGAANRLSAMEGVDELRFRILPTLVSMSAETQPFGVGFGAFEYAYRMVEPAELLGPAYLNNAHNDWLQLAIEGGIPGLLILATGIFVMLRQALRLRNASVPTPGGDWDRREAIADATMAFVVILLLAGASIFDYPVRTPSVMALATVCLAMLCSPAISGFSRNSDPAGEFEEGSAPSHEGRD
ncbi:MAG: O-antigen ligase family protein [Alteraurantiacibacter sp.]